jgi:hypothetical protein
MEKEGRWERKKGLSSPTVEEVKQRNPIIGLDRRLRLPDFKTIGT